MKIQPLEESGLIRGCRQQERWAQKKLYEHYAPAMLGVCVRYLNDQEIAKDALHEGFIIIFSKISSLREESSLEGWMRRIVISVCLLFLKRQQRIVFWGDYEEVPIVESTDETVIESLSAEEIRNCIAELSPQMRFVFNLYAVEGYSHAEIAELLKIKEASSRSLYLRARRMLQEKLKELYYYNGKAERYR